ncbi:MAG: hypothetical protein JWN14_1527 [Chthonomonadales bacterium]|nr:hypothetical protein [Chthonomonadales bacterium]
MKAISLAFITANGDSIGSKLLADIAVAGSDETVPTERPCAMQEQMVTLITTIQTTLTREGLRLAQSDAELEVAVGVALLQGSAASEISIPLIVMAVSDDRGTTHDDPSLLDASGALDWPALLIQAAEEELPDHV